VPGVTNLDKTAKILEASQLQFEINLDSKDGEAWGYTVESIDRESIYSRIIINVGIGVVHQMTFDIRNVCISDYLEVFGQPDIFTINSTRDTYTIYYDDKRIISNMSVEGYIYRLSMLDDTYDDVKSLPQPELQSMEMLQELQSKCKQYN